MGHYNVILFAIERVLIMFKDVVSKDIIKVTILNLTNHTSQLVNETWSLFTKFTNKQKYYKYYGMIRFFMELGEYCFYQRGVELAISRCQFACHKYVAVRWFHVISLSYQTDGFMETVWGHKCTYISFTFLLLKEICVSSRSTHLCE